MQHCFRGHCAVGSRGWTRWIWSSLCFKRTIADFVSTVSHYFLSQSSWSAGTLASTMNHPAETLRAACSSAQKLLCTYSTMLIWTEMFCFLSLPKSQCAIFFVFPIWLISQSGPSTVSLSFEGNNYTSSQPKYEKGKVEQSATETDWKTKREKHERHKRLWSGQMLLCENCGNITWTQREKLMAL